MNNRSAGIGAFGLVIAAVMLPTSCSSREKNESLTPASRVETPIAPQQAVQDVSAARCAHEQKCQNVGPDREYQSEGHCLEVMRSDATSSLAGCENGIAERDLRKCQSEIANQDCKGVSSAFDRLDTYMSCRTNALCLN